MTDRFRCVLSSDEFSCGGCRQKVSVGIHSIEVNMERYCLICGEKELIKVKGSYMEQIRLIMKALDKLNKFPKDKVIQRLS